MDHILVLTLHIMPCSMNNTGERRYMSVCMILLNVVECFFILMHFGCLSIDVFLKQLKKEK